MVMMNGMTEKQSLSVLFKDPHSAEAQPSLLLLDSEMICSSGLSVLSPFSCSLRVYFTAHRFCVCIALCIVIFTTSWFNWWFQSQIWISWLHKINVTNTTNCDKSYRHSLQLSNKDLNFNVFFFDILKSWLYGKGNLKVPYDFFLTQLCQILAFKSLFNRIFKKTC